MRGAPPQEGPRQAHRPTRWAHHPTLPSPPAWPGSQELSIPAIHARAAHTPTQPSRAGPGEQKPTGPSGSPLTSPGRKPDLETRCGKTLLHSSISQNILCGLAGPVAARLPAAGPDVLRPPSARVPTGADLTWQSPEGNDAHSLLSQVSGSFDVSGVWRGPNSRQMRRSVFPVLMILLQLSAQTQADPVSPSPSANPAQGARPGHC